MSDILSSPDTSSPEVSSPELASRESSSRESSSGESSSSKSESSRGSSSPESSGTMTNIKTQIHHWLDTGLRQDPNFATWALIAVKQQVRDKYPEMVPLSQPPKLRRPRSSSEDDRGVESEVDMEDDRENGRQDQRDPPDMRVHKRPKKIYEQYAELKVTPTLRLSLIVGYTSKGERLWRSP
jgi:hypothetical protein